MQLAPADRRRWPARAALVALLAASGCGPSADGDRARPAGDAAAAFAVEDRDATTALAAALRDTAAGSPERTILTLYLYARWGDGASVARAYHPKVRLALGDDRIAAIYAADRERLRSDAVPRIARTGGGADRLSLAVELRSADGRRRRESFGLRRGPARWTIAYDSFVDRAERAARRGGAPARSRVPFGELFGDR